MDNLTLSAVRRVDAACLKFEDAWKAGERPRAAEPERSALLRELLSIEVEYLRRPWDFTVSDLPTVDSGGVPSIPGYEILGELGRGAMGIVYKVWNQHLKRSEAMKCILSGQLASAEEVERFKRDYLAAAALDHPYIVRVYHVGEHGGQHFFTMQLIKGPTLAQRIGRGVIPSREAARLVAAVAWAVHYAHCYAPGKGIIHRDLKPANILLDAADTPYVTDFGLAMRVEGGGELTRSGSVVGTPEYMAPEQAEGRQHHVTARTDVYGLGAVLYALLTGRPPFRAESVFETLKQVITDQPDSPKRLNPNVPDDLQVICLKCLEKSPPARYESAEKLAEDLDNYLNDRPINARPSSWVKSIISHGERFDPATWGRLALWASGVGFLHHLAIFWLVVEKAPAWLFWLVFWVPYNVGWVGIALILVRRQKRLARDERHLLALYIGTHGAALTSWLLGGGWTPAGALAVYPIWCALMGVQSVVQGSIYWGWFYLIGLAWFALVVLNFFTGDWAPFEFALLFGVSQGLIGWHLLNRARKEGRV